MTHRDPQVHLDRSETRCTQDGWCRDNPSGCARYMAPIAPGSPVEDFSLPPNWWGTNRSTVSQCPKRLAIGSRQQPTTEQPRRVHRPLGSEQC